MFVVAYLYKGINLGVLETINIGITLNIGSVVFLIMALLIGRLDSLSQPIGTITYLVLSFWVVYGCQWQLCQNFFLRLQLSCHRITTLAWGGDC